VSAVQAEHTKFLVLPTMPTIARRRSASPMALSTGSNYNVLPEWILTGEKALPRPPG